MTLACCPLGLSVGAAWRHCTCVANIEKRSNAIRLAEYRAGSATMMRCVESVAMSGAEKGSLCAVSDSLA